MGRSLPAHRQLALTATALLLSTVKTMTAIAGAEGAQNTIQSKHLISNAYFK